MTPKHDDPHAVTINGAVQQVTQELKQILKRDFNRKMVEFTAFKRFESWWEEESRKQNEPLSVFKKDEEKPRSAVTTTKDNINILLEANRENLYGSIGLDNSGALGLRASLPKMPSFRRKKLSSPVTMDDGDIHKADSDNEEIVHDSEDEVVSQNVMKSRKVSSSSDEEDECVSKRPERKESSESSSDETSAFSSSDEDSGSEDESSSESEHELKMRNRRSVTPQDRTTPVPPITVSPLTDDFKNITTQDEYFDLMQTDQDRSENADSQNNFGGKFEASEIKQKYVDSDSDMSEGEKEYLERRRKNTEWMEQIERERMSRQSIVQDTSPVSLETINVKKSETIIKIEDVHNNEKHKLKLTHQENSSTRPVVDIEDKINKKELKIEGEAVEHGGLEIEAESQAKVVEMDVTNGSAAKFNNVIDSLITNDNPNSQVRSQSIYSNSFPCNVL